MNWPLEVFGSIVLLAVYHWAVYAQKGGVLLWWLLAVTLCGIGSLVDLVHGPPFREAVYHLAWVYVGYKAADTLVWCIKEGIHRRRSEHGLR